MRTLYLAALAAVLVGIASPGRANLVQNGDFSLGIDRTTSITDWTVSYTGAHTGDSVLFLNSADYRACCGVNDTGTGDFVSYGAGNSPDTGQVSQSFATSPGAKYNLSFLYGSFGFQGAEQSLTVAAGSLSATITTLTSTVDLSAVLAPYSYTFTATGATTTLSFSDISTITNSVDAFLDNVVVTPAVAAPEPFSLGLLATAWVGVGIARRRSR